MAAVATTSVPAPAAQPAPAPEPERPIEELFTEDQLVTYKEVFSVFDKDEDGFVAAKEIGPMLRAVVQNPTQAEIRGMVLEMDPLQIGNKLYDFPTFLRYVSRRMKEYDTEEELREAFRVFDKEQNGQVSAAELREVVTTLGEVFTPDEVSLLMKDAKVNAEGMINYEGLIKMMMKK
ncbi:hypothetical protein SELMODRAFT_159200 [Selaginella moellendorffii]|uniref:EF-hand domain-containing protein n=1 Tax=Selaginella moellendorffii TaxID=88036 RepID=D8SXQ6_SELML|nr:calmodulin [Selaginella moellendorffii]EFJ10845.1 hypothetical protein SELMODRAFT_159200 [Selaginella moellendorffii]|eukprot:XP_002988053.1 calmodulin [Selaginella moellendorffii]